MTGDSENDIKYTITKPSQETYEVRMCCGNCRHTWTERVLKGLPVNYGSSRKCPHCECNRGYKVW